MFKFKKTIISIVLISNSFAFDAHLFNKSNKSGTSQTTGIFQNEKYNYHYKCGYNTQLNKNDFANFPNLSSFSSRVNNEPAISFMNANGIVKFFYFDVNKNGSDRIKFTVENETFFAKVGSSGWLVSKGIQPDNKNYKEIQLETATDYKEQAFHYEEQLAIALTKYGTNKAKIAENSLSNDQLINCSKLAGKSENKTIKTALSNITDIETKESYREIASEQKKYLDSRGGSEGGTTGGTSGITR